MMNIKLIKGIFSTIFILQGCFLTTVCQTKQTEGKSGKSGSRETVMSDKPKVYQIRPQDLPKPYATESVRRGSKIIEPPPGAKLSVPAGFKINVFAEGGFSNPRWMALAPNGDVFLADSRSDSIIILRDKNKDGIAEERFTFVENLSQPFGMAFNGDWFYVANTDSVVRFKYKIGQTKAEAAPEKLINLTEGGYNQHWTRNIIFSPDGKKLYVSIGSSGNVDVEKDERRAAISEYNPDGTGYRLFASGLRNPIGLAWNPANKQLWTAVNERDGLGDDLVPDFVTSVKDGGFYGFPFSYIGQNEEPRRKGENPELIKKAIVPDVLLTSHSAALGLIFYNGKMFPKDYNGDAFAALHGSWNREKLTGYKIIRVRFKDGKLVDNAYEDFVSGWLPEETANEVWGRPVGLLVNADGSLLITDDGAKKIWRVSFQK
ncbi:MAG TPA: sorbosone dehydrogenase family protein [Pyrinomonadaceae bacterium]|nr:sorbosone dehydrogenase family protein [Pyrinomonadaceae bacterium]